jgi:tRNA nucleotidyltransferase/poly(A) polymerase
MSDIPIAAMRAVAERLDELGLEYAFLGGSVVGLLLDHPELSPVRATDDVDVVIGGFPTRVTQASSRSCGRISITGRVEVADVRKEVAPAAVAPEGL